MNQTCEFGRFYYVIATKRVIRCVASATRDGGYWFADDAVYSGGSLRSTSDVALIPHMTSWDCELPKHPEEGWRFVDLQTESIEPGDQRCDGYGTWWDESCVDPSKNKHLPCRRRIEPDHVAELRNHLESPSGVLSHKELCITCEAIVGELLALREQVKGGDA